ncbi:MAG: hypothetical protein ACO3FE_16690, partial [Planctomycetaceae bacterium]
TQKTQRTAVTIVDPVQHQCRKNDNCRSHDAIPFALPMLLNLVSAVGQNIGIRQDLPDRDEV